MGRNVMRGATATGFYTGFSHRRLRCGAFAALMVACEWAGAAGPLPTAQYRIEQPAQPLSDSLLAIARQTGASVLFDPAIVRGRTARAVSGQLSAADAIEKVLQGSGLVLEFSRDGALLIKVAPVPPGNAAAPSETTSSAPSSGAASAVRLAQAGVAGASDAGAASADEPKSLLTGNAQTVEITGSRLRRIDSEGPLPVNVYRKVDIDRSGQPTLERFLSTLNEASMSQGEGSQGSTFGQGTVQLRGLPLGSTLVLVNGRRVQAVGSSSGNYFNLNLIPMAAIERVEVLPVGSSAVYGGDALAGVVNVILKKSLEGYALDLGLTTGRDFSGRQLSLTTGGSDQDGSFLVLGAYSKSTPLRMGDRDFFQNWDFRPLGGPDVRSRNCTPGTVTSATAANLPGLNATFAGIPQNAAGQQLTAANFAATAGQANLCTSIANGYGQALTFDSETFSLHAVGERRLVDDMTVFGELTYTDDDTRAEENGVLLGNVLVPATNPYNPFGTAVRVTGRMGLDNGVTGIDRTTRYKRLLGGVRGGFGERWDYEVSLSTSRDDGRRLQFNDTVNAAALNAALASSTPATALNPFTTGRAASDDVLHGIWSDGLRVNHGRKNQVAGFVRGPLLDLPAGTVDAIAGAEWSSDLFDSVQTTRVRGTRTAKAAFGEMRVPLLRGEGAGVKPWTLATLTLAARHDRYNDFGGATTYQAGLETRPSPTFLVRAAAATSFKPPTLLQTNVTPDALDIGGYGLLDPARGNAPIIAGQGVRATNPNLGPEEGKAYALGASWEPDAAAGTRLGVTAWRVHLTDVITLLAPQLALNNEALFPGFVTRQPSVNGVPGVVTRVLITEVNFGRLQTSGVDFEASQSWKATGGVWNGSVQATRTSKYTVLITPGSAIQDRAGRRAVDYWAPTWKGRVAAGFEQGSWGLGLTSRYVGAYKDAGTSDRRLGDFWVHDLSGRLDLKKLGVGLPAVKAAVVTLAVVNLGNRLPQFVGSTPYYDVSQADWRGRYAAAKLSIDW